MRQDLNEVLENLDLLSTSELFLAKLQETPGGDLEYAQRQLSVLVVLMNDWKLYYASLRHTTNSPLVHELALTAIETLSRITLRTSTERAILARMLSLLPHAPHSQDSSEGDGPRLLSIEEWMSEFEGDGERFSSKVR